MKTLLSICLVTVWLALQPAHAQQLTIGFDAPPIIPAGASYGVTNYFEQGIAFEPLGPAKFFGRTGSGASFAADNGTAYLDAAISETLQFGFFNERLFGVVSVDLAEYSVDAPPVTVQFVGYRPDGSTVSQSFTTDGIIDGTGPLADFQTFLFGPEFSGLERVEIPTSDWSLDNLVIIVPEPSSASLLLLGALCFWQARRRERQGE